MQSVPSTTNVVSSNPTQGGVLNTTLCDKVCQWLVAGGGGVSQGTPVSCTSKTDHHDITEILLKVALNTITKPSIPIRNKESGIQIYCSFDLCVL